jgi:hypothetical protein
MDEMENRENYFANEPVDKIGDCLKEKVENWYNYINASGYYRVWKSSYRYFYNGFHTRGEIQRYGKQAEKRVAMVNHYHSLLQHIKVLTTNQRPVFEPRAVNSDFKSAAQVMLARDLLDYYMRHENLEQIIDTCMEYALQAGEGFIALEWDPDIGKEVGQYEDEVPNEESGEMEKVTRLKREGNIKSSAYHPLDVVRDFYLNNIESNNWFILRRRVNKYELSAKYPRFKEVIEGMDLDIKLNSDCLLEDFDNKMLQESDLIHEYVFRHAKTSAVPEGRQTVFLEDGTVIFDGVLPYTDISIYRLIPIKRINTNIGYTIAFDLLPLQRILDMLDSTIVTNQSSYGVNNITAQKGSGVTLNQLSGGMNLIEYNTDKPPQILELLKTPQEIFAYRQTIIQDMETLSGVNSVSRGNPEASLKSGAALALVQSMAIQYNSGLQHSYAQTLEQIGTGIINLLKDYASAPRVASITGISNRAYLKEFTRDDIDQIDRVVVDMGNPMSRTLSGRITVADSLLERGMIPSSEQYLQMINTGRLEPMVQGQTADLMLIKSENEQMLEAKTPNAYYTDNHWLHIKEHATVLSSTDVRGQGGAPTIKAVTAHNEHHIRLLRETNPELLMVLGQQPLAGKTQAPAVPPQGGELSPQQGQPTGPQDMAAPGPKGIEPPQMAKMPNMPQNPLSGQPFNPVTGGLPTPQ